MALKKGALKRLSKDFKSAKIKVGDETGAQIVIPKGNYVFNKIKMELSETKAGEPCVKMWVDIIEGDFEGETAFSMINLGGDHPDWGMERLCKVLNFFGLEVDDFEDELEEALKEITDNEACTVKGQLDSDNMKMFFNEIVDEGDVPDAGDDKKSGDNPDDDLDDMDRDELEEVAEDLGAKPRKMKKLDDDELRDWIEGARDESNDDSEPEKEKEEKATKKPAKKSAARKSKSDDTGDDKKLKKGLMDLCETFGIEFNKKDDIDTLTESISELTFKKKDLEEDELELLKSIGIKVK